MQSFCPYFSTSRNNNGRVILGNGNVVRCVLQTGTDGWVRFGGPTVTATGDDYGLLRNQQAFFNISDALAFDPAGGGILYASTFGAAAQYYFQTGEIMDEGTFLPQATGTLIADVVAARVLLTRGSVVRLVNPVSSPGPVFVRVGGPLVTALATDFIVPAGTEAAISVAPNAYAQDGPPAGGQMYLSALCPAGASGLNYQTGAILPN